MNYAKVEYELPKATICFQCLVLLLSLQKNKNTSIQSLITGQYGDKPVYHRKPSDCGDL